MKFLRVLIVVAAAFVSSAALQVSAFDDQYFYPHPPSFHYGPPFSCVFSPEAQLGLFRCLTPGTAICRDGWAFGIDAHDGYVKLWDPYGMVVYGHFPNAKKFCIGEQSGAYMHDFYSHPWYDVKAPFLFALFDDGASSAWLHCNGVGRDDKDAVLKIVNYNDRPAAGGDPIVKFKKGPGDENALWSIDAFGRERLDYGCDWFLDTAAGSGDTLVPSTSPSSTLSNVPSMSPSSTLSNVPSMSPSSVGCIKSTDELRAAVDGTLNENLDDVYIGLVKENHPQCNIPIL